MKCGASHAISHRTPDCTPSASTGSLGRCSAPPVSLSPAVPVPLPAVSPPHEPVHYAVVVHLVRREHGGVEADTGVVGDGDFHTRASAVDTPTACDDSPPHCRASPFGWLAGDCGIRLLTTSGGAGITEHIERPIRSSGSRKKRTNRETSDRLNLDHGLDNRSMRGCVAKVSLFPHSRIVRSSHHLPTG